MSFNDMLNVVRAEAYREALLEIIRAAPKSHAARVARNVLAEQGEPAPR